MLKNPAADLYLKKMIQNKTLKKSILFGILGSLSLSSLYFLILTLLNSAEHALSQFLDLWYLMIPLIIGFGIQIGLYVYVKESFKMIKAGAATSAVTASGGVSAVSMAACCAHHLTDILPLIGLTFLSAFLIKYQISFILLGVLSNILGIIMMLGVIQKNSLHESWKGVFGWMMTPDMGKIFKVSVGLSILIFGISVYITVIGG